MSRPQCPKIVPATGVHHLRRAATNRPSDHLLQRETVRTSALHRGLLVTVRALRGNPTAPALLHQHRSPTGRLSVDLNVISTVGLQRAPNLGLLREQAQSGQHTGRRNRMDFADCQEAKAHAADSHEWTSGSDPSALFLASKARAAEFDSVFHNMQALELAAGAANISLLGLNIRDGLRMKGWLRRRPA